MEASVTVTSPALAEFALMLLWHASFFMMARVAPSAYQLLAATGLPEGSLREVAEQLRTVWSKFTSDMGPSQFHRLCDEMRICRYVDSFHYYLSSMLREVFLQRPETLRTSAQVKLRDVLACADIDEVVRLVAERKVDTLAYQGLDEVMEYLQSSLGMPAPAESSLVGRVREAIEVRNVIVHNAGRVNKHFLRRTGRTDLADGTAFPLDSDLRREFWNVNVRVRQGPRCVLHPALQSQLHAIGDSAASPRRTRG